MRGGAACGVDLGIERLGVVAGELDGHAVGIDHIDRAAIAMLERVGVRRGEAARGDAALDLGLLRGADMEGDVDEGRRGDVRHEQLFILLLGELEEGQSAAIAHLEEEMAIGALLAEQLVLLAIGRRQREAEEILVEGARRLRSLDT